MFYCIFQQLINDNKNVFLTDLPFGYFFLLLFIYLNCLTIKVVNTYRLNHPLLFNQSTFAAPQSFLWSPGDCRSDSWGTSDVKIIASKRGSKRVSKRVTVLIIMETVVQSTKAVTIFLHLTWV